MYDYTDLYDPDDHDLHDTGDDNARIVGRHTEKECAYYRDEMARREAQCQALGVGKEYRQLMAAVHGRLPEPPSRKALPGLIPESRRLPAPKEESPADPNSREEE